MKKIFLICLMALLLIGCTSDKANNTIVIGTSSGYPPYEVIDTEGNLTGFDIEFGEALAKELGYDGVTWEDGNFDGLIGKLQVQSIDLAIAGLSPDPTREAVFSDAYYFDGENPLYILTKEAGNIKASDDIKDKVAGAQLGTIQESALNQIKEAYNLTIDTRNDYGTIVQEILLDRIDFLMVEPAVGEEFLVNYDGLVLFEFESEAIAPLNGVSVAMPLDTEMEDEVNAAISKLKEDGTIDALVAKYFE